MKAKHLIETLQFFIEKNNDEMEVLIQSDCCPHGHEIGGIELGQEKYKGIDTSDELNKIVIRI